MNLQNVLVEHLELLTVYLEELEILQKVNDGGLLMISNMALSKLGIDQRGLDELIIYIYVVLLRNLVVVQLDESIASTIGEEPTTIEDVFEPYLLQEGYIKEHHVVGLQLTLHIMLGKKYYKGLLD